MKVWKSPVFYLGVILVTAVIAALLAPFVVDWSSYRAGLEDYGRKLTGREVAIAGPISVRLFPWPSLTASDVHIANPPGIEEPEFATASRVSLRLQLASLLNGIIDVESIEIDQPAIAVERNSKGEGNWGFTPAAGLAGNELLGRVKLDRITLSDATIRLIDRHRGNGEIELKLPEARIASPGITGPWRLSAENVEYAGQNFDISLNTGIWTNAEQFRFSLHVAGADRSGSSFNFDGARQGDRLAGVIQIETAAKAEGKTDVEGQLRPLLIRSKAAATFDELTFDQIEISPLDPSSGGGTLMSGSAKLALGARISAAADLSAPKLDLAEWAGARAAQVLREGGSLAVADSLLAMLPAGLDVSGSLKVTSLAAGGETLENVKLRMEASRQAVRVRELSATLPGHSRILFDGVFFPGKIAAELAGNLALESNDLRQLTSWSWPESKAGIAKVWTGSRGRLKLQTELSLTAQRFRLSRAQYELDGAPGRAELAVTAGGGGAVDLRIDAETLDIDNLMPGGIAAVSSGDKTGLARFLPFLAPHKDARDMRLVLQTGKLLLNGVEADDVTVDVIAGASGFDLKTIEIGSVGGATLNASGLVLDTGSGPDGSISIDVKAGDPRGLLRLLGLIPVANDPVWSKALGATAIKGTVSVKTPEHGPVASFDVTGKSGDFEINALGSLSGYSDFGKLRIDGSVDIKAPSSASFAKLAGFVPAAADHAAARVAVTSSGSLTAGFLTDAKLEAYGARLDFKGTLGGSGKPAAVDGRLGLRSVDISLLLAAMGLPATELPGGVLVLDSPVKWDTSGVTLDGFTGRFGEEAIGGGFNWAPDGKITGNLDVGPLALTDILAATFLSWNGLPPKLDASLAEALPLGLAGEIWIKPKSLKVHDTFTASEAQIGISAAPGEIHLAMFGKDQAGKDAAIEIGSRGNDGNRMIEGKIKLPIDLSQQLRLADGGAVANGNGALELGFTAKGRSPGGAMAELQGSGSYDIKGFELLHISPENFARALAEAKDAAGINAAFDALRGEGGFAAGDARGSITLANGVAAFLPFTRATEDAVATVKTVAEPADGLVDISVMLALKARAGLPAMEISYSGPPTALARAEDKAELVSRLGYGILQKDVAELERMQQEQLRLAAEEEKLRQDDEAKLQAYYAQREEVQLRRRELKVHAEMRVFAAGQSRQQIESQHAANAEINRAEIKKRARELRVHRRLAELEQQPDAIEVAPLPRAKPRKAERDAQPEFRLPAFLRRLARPQKDK